jgi:L-aspartate oxidase
VVRSASSLAAAADELAAVAAGVPESVDRETGELRNLVTMANAVLAAATEREETRGAHSREDFPEPVEQLRCRLVHGAVPPAALHQADGTPIPPGGRR